MVVADPRQVYTLLLAPFSSLDRWGRDGRWQAGRLSPHLNPSYRRGSGREGVLVGAQLENIFSPTKGGGGLHYIVRGCTTLF
jgi:hypothetical protein